MHRYRYQPILGLEALGILSLSVVGLKGEFLGTKDRILYRFEYVVQYACMHLMVALL